ncbi:hypothetical protein [Sphingomonas glacialis]|uniref:DUF2269 family protein n=1 Tax=Sphingomonas glacialis TaxID=658225 RepID=A0A502FXL5_9SPHN|nr:hypothetical protein [Sphingomonas glacialis]TPG54248.1 hypothetical protein EAH76_06065 [Sphingomonas glacialis]
MSLAYPTLLFVHLLLFVLWLGADVGVFVLGQHFRKRTVYTLDQRLALLKLLVEVDMVPRTAWALMVPISLSVVRLGGFWLMPDALLVGAWGIGAIWIWLVWDAHLHDQTPRAKRDRRIEFYLKIALAGFYLVLGGVSLVQAAPLAAPWLAMKALMFGLIFAAAIMIDVAFKPVGPLLVRLVGEGSSDTTEAPLLRTMNRTRWWVWTVYLLLLTTAYLGLVKPF